VCIELDFLVSYVVAVALVDVVAAVDAAADDDDDVVADEENVLGVRQM